MADVKWIKIVTDIFDDEKMLMIESLPSADSIMIVWFKLLCLAGKTNNSGVFIFNDKIAYTDEMLSSIFRRDINTVRMALKTFEAFGMIEIVDNVITLPNWSKHQSLEAYERRKAQDRLRKQTKRAEQKALISAKSADTSADTSADVRTLDIDIDIDKDKDKDCYIYTVSNETVRQTDSVRRAIDAWNNLSDVGIRQVSKVKSDSKRYKLLIARIKQYGIDDVLTAIERIRSSSFLQGKNKSGFTITFDWFVRPNNFPKVLEGNFDDKGVNSNGTTTGDAGKWERYDTYL